MTEENANLDFIGHEIHFFKKKIVELENKMDRILEILEKDLKKMNDHIDFVENVYDNVKMPFHYVMNKMNLLVSTENHKKLELDPPRDPPMEEG